MSETLTIEIEVPEDHDPFLASIRGAATDPDEAIDALCADIAEDIRPHALQRVYQTHMDIETQRRQIAQQAGLGAGASVSADGGALDVPIGDDADDDNGEG